MTRLLLFLLAGWIVGAALSVGTDHVFHVTNVYPPYGEQMLDNGLLLLALRYRAVFIVLSCYLAAMWAKEKARKAVWSLGIIGTVLWLGGTIAMWEFAQPWYNIAGIVTSIPFALLGGKLYELRTSQAKAAACDAH